MTTQKGIISGPSAMDLMFGLFDNNCFGTRAIYFSFAEGPKGNLHLATLRGIEHGDAPNEWVLRGILLPYQHAILLDAIGTWTAKYNTQTREGVITIEGDHEID